MQETQDGDLVGQVVEQRYRIEELLGTGATGKVFRARHVKVGREVAIKVLHEHLVRDPAMVARFEREAAIAARLHHRNLVPVVDVGETAARQRLMVLELARGESLAAILGRGPLSCERAVHLVRQLLHGLAHAHAAGLVHRDLKPENVIVERDLDGAEVPRIVDFGIAVLRAFGDGSAAGRRITETGIVMGTPAYMAPEQSYGEDPDPRSDLFALGVMLYEMLTGVRPFDGTGMQVIVKSLSRDAPAMARRAPGLAVDPLLEAFTRRLMARDLRERLASAQAALEVLALIQRDREEAAAVLGVAAETDRVPTAPSRVAAIAGAVARGSQPELLPPRPLPRAEERTPILRAVPRTPVLPMPRITERLPVWVAPTTRTPPRFRRGSWAALGFAVFCAVAMVALAVGAA